MRIPCAHGRLTTGRGFFPSVVAGRRSEDAKKPPRRNVLTSEKTRDPGKEYRAFLIQKHPGAKLPIAYVSLPSLSDETLEDLLLDCVQAELAIRGRPTDEREQFMFDELVDSRFDLACHRRRFELADGKTAGQYTAARVARILGWQA